MSDHSELIRKIIKAIQSRGGVAFHVFSGLIKTGRFAIHGAEDGTFDVIGCYKGHFLAFDAKVGKDVLSDDQIEFMAKVRDNGGVAMAIYDAGTITGLLDSLDTER